MSKKTHDLKTWKEFYEAIYDGKKTFEIRKNDRDFQVGDILVLHEFDTELGEQTGQWCSAEITYMTEWEQKDGYVVMAIDVFHSMLPTQYKATVEVK